MNTVREISQALYHNFNFVSSCIFSSGPSLLQLRLALNLLCCRERLCSNDPPVSTSLVLLLTECPNCGPAVAVSMSLCWWAPGLLRNGAAVCTHSWCTHSWCTHTSRIPPRHSVGTQSGRVSNSERTGQIAVHGGCSTAYPHPQSLVPRRMALFPTAQ